MQLEDVTSPPGEIILVELDFSGFSSNVGAISMEVGLDGNLLTIQEEIFILPMEQNYSEPAHDSENTLLFSMTNMDGTDVNETLSLTFDYKGGFSSDLEFNANQCEIVGADLTEITGISYTDGSVSPAYLTEKLHLARFRLNNEDISVPITQMIWVSLACFSLRS
ncbi:MAG: hypothetical protein U5L09_12650 [Bacteroidales bacterium]|nr:hypothetical protein [Bacteroidales bacterium]